jgi:hypothetical protein
LLSENLTHHVDQWTPRVYGRPVRGALLLAQLVLVTVFATAAIAKLRDRTGTREAVAEFGVPSRLAGPLSALLPAAELAVALALIPARTSVWGALGGLVLLLAFSAAISVNLARGRAPDCHCFGQLHSSPAGPRTLARNGALIALAGFLASHGDPIWTALATAGAIALGATGWALSRRLSAPAGSQASAGGLAVGTPAPSFRLPALDGSSVSLESLLELGSPALLLFSDSGCGPCQALAPDVANWQRRHSDELTIAVIERRRDRSAGAHSDEHGRRNLLQHESEVADSYHAAGTPAAVLVGADGRVASAMAVGSLEITALVARNVWELEPSPVEIESESGWPGLEVIGRPLFRRDLFVRAAGASAAASAFLGWPARAMSILAPRRGSDCKHNRDCAGNFEECRSGRCVCPSGWRRCSGDCTLTLIDRTNCGGCGRSCAPDEACVNGGCVGGDGSDCGGRCNCGGRCDSGLNAEVCCKGECTNPNFRERNCGGCGIVCTGETPDCCLGKCTDFASDPDSCGVCGLNCDRKQVCNAGKCRDECPQGLRQCGRTCGHPRTQVCCKGKVIDKADLQFNDENCGSCGNDCAKLTSASKPACCSGRCVDLASNVDNCGACGNKCSEVAPGCACGVTSTGQAGCYFGSNCPPPPA